jgi:dihydroorotase
LDIILKNINIFSPNDNLDLRADIMIKDGYIAEIGSIPERENFKNQDCKDLTAVPGFFDMHVHFRDPGQSEKEDLSSGTEASANGGFTGVLMMPNTIPPIDSVEVISDLLNRAKNSVVDVYTSACISAGRKGESLSSVKELHSAGAIAFTDDGSPQLNTELMSEILMNSAKLNFPVLQHAENPAMHPGGVINEGEVSKKLGLKGIPCESETSVATADILLANSIEGSKYHIQHISCGKTLEVIRNAKKENKNITCEICSHHFILTEENCIEMGSNAKMNPPLRTQNDVDTLINGIKDGTIDVLCSDHAPHSDSDKLSGIEKSPFGIIGIEVSIGLAYTYLIKNKIIDFKRFVEMFSINPRRILGLEQISIRKGAKANLTILNTNQVWKADKRKFKSKSRNTPYNEFELVCKPFAIINNNQIYYSEL